jgi:hypothetical protein
MTTNSSISVKPAVLPALRRRSLHDGIIREKMRS